MTTCTVVTEALRGSPLSQAARAGGVPRAWYRPMPTGRDEWRTYALEVAASVPETWLDDMRDAFGASGRARERLERVAGGRGIVLTTGQQPGLFGGPLMTFNKALSARALADVLEDELGIPVAPVFWAATDDADFEEAAGVWIATATGAEELRINRTAPAGTPMAAAAIGEDIVALASRLREACGSAPNPSPLSAALDAYAPGRTVGGAYVALLRSLLEPLGIAVLDASHAAVRGAAAPTLLRAAERAEAVAAAVRERDEEIRAAGFDPQVDDVPGLSLIFTNEGGVKRRVPIVEARSQASRWAREALSPTVLLRPVVERAILPTAAYVAGPGEFAYFAQVSPVARSLGVPLPLVVPRWSATIIEPRVERGLAELGLTREDLRDPHAVESRLARRLLPDPTAQSLRRLRDHVVEDIAALERENDGLVPPASLDGLRASLLHRLERAERRFAAAVKRREGNTMQRVGALRGTLYPDGSPQERKLSVVPFLTRFGDTLVADMLEHATAHGRSLIARAGGAIAAEAPSLTIRA
jgi:bacillithiol synthase